MLRALNVLMIWNRPIPNWSSNWWTLNSAKRICKNKFWTNRQPSKPCSQRVTNLKTGFQRQSKVANKRCEKRIKFKLTLARWWLEWPKTSNKSKNCRRLSARYKLSQTQTPLFLEVSLPSQEFKNRAQSTRVATASALNANNWSKNATHCPKDVRSWKSTLKNCSKLTKCST